MSVDTGTVFQDFSVAILSSAQKNADKELKTTWKNPVERQKLEKISEKDFNSLSAD